MSCLAVIAKTEILFIHCNILSHFLPARVLCIGGRIQKTRFLASPCVSCLELLGDTFCPIGFAPEVLPPIRNSQVQVKEGEVEILSKELSLEPRRCYNT